MDDHIKIATWNVCLGLKCKKDYISNKIIEERVDICSIQECEIEPDYPENLLTLKNYQIEVETNTKKSRCCVLGEGKCNKTHGEYVVSIH